MSGSRLPADNRLENDALKLLRLAEAIPPDGFLALKGVATASLAIIDHVVVWWCPS